MGIPVKFVCAVTSNDIVARAVTKGDYSMSKNVIPTLAPAMDIQVTKLCCLINPNVFLVNRNFYQSCF